MMLLLELCGRDVAEGSEEAVMIEPPYPAEGGEFEILEAGPEAWRVDQLGPLAPESHGSTSIDLP